MTPAEKLKLKAQARLRLKQKAAPSSVPVAAPADGFDQFKGMMQAGEIQQPMFDPAGNFQKLDDVVRTASNGATFGLADRFAGFMNGTGTDAERAQSAGATERLGPMAPVAEIGGSVLTGGGLSKLGLTATRLPGVIGKYAGMAIDGSLFGAAQAAGNGEDVGAGAEAGAAFGAAGQAGGKLLSSLMKKMPATMSKDELYAAGSAAFKRARDTGVIFTKDSIGLLRDKIYKDFAEMSFHPKLQPGAAVAFEELDRLAQGGHVDFQGLKTAREIASDAFIPGNKKNNALTGAIIKQIDNFAMQAPPEHILTGDAGAASQAVTEARKYWHMASKLDTVDKLLERAGRRAARTGSGGNIENTTRQEMSKLLDSEKKSRGFTKDEMSAVDNAVVGTKTRNTLRQLGKFSPVGNGLIATLEALAALGGKAAAVPHAVPLIVGGAAAGTGAKYASEALQRKATERVLKLIAAGGKNENIKPTISPEKAKQIEHLFRALAIGGTSAAVAH